MLHKYLFHVCEKQENVRLEFLYLTDVTPEQRTLKMFKGRLVGPFQHCIRRLIVRLPPNEFLHSSPEAPRTTQMRETSASEERNYYQGI